MPNLPADTDIDSWHRYFAILNNNRAWELAVAKRSIAEDRELLNCAHASATHWAAVGTELHIVRTNMLLAEVHSLLGLSTSYTLATEVLDFFLAQENTPDWEIAFAHTIHAHAAATVGNIPEHSRSYDNAISAIMIESTIYFRKVHRLYGSSVNVESPWKTSFKSTFE